MGRSSDLDIQRASMVLPRPGTSSISRCPRHISVTMDSEYFSALKIIKKVGAAERDKEVSPVP